MDKNTKNKKTTGKEVEKPSTSSSGHLEKGKVKRPNKNRLPFELPKLGEPGGRDDPLRRGLSGAGVRRYLRHLHQGLAPEEARKQALSHPTPKVTPTGKHNKRGPELITPPTRPLPKRQKTAVAKTGQVTGYAAAVKAEKTSRVGIMPKDYPKATLEAEQLSSLEDILVEEMCQSQERGIHFTGVHFRNGMMLVDCGSQGSAEWIMKSVPQLKSWKGPELVVLRGDDIPKPTNITVFFPRSQEMEPEKILRLVEVQNSNLNTGAWRILNSRKEGKGTVLTIGIDPQTEETLKAGGCCLNFRFGRIPVSGLKNKNVPVEGSVDVEMPSTSREPEVQGEGADSSLGQAVGSAGAPMAAEIPSAALAAGRSCQLSGSAFSDSEREEHRKESEEEQEKMEEGT
ncbi:uncharacterized protein LOC123318214 [Coccinella septempunctata]|uniref:uncharacterized protein LOC123318214 n=1 Tax=Coccinella septempunctata TaxID=41139 RepID=UPI001D05DB34|nr:uncharacterized protein LOC123318214 [Coccinella septempunctata]